MVWRCAAHCANPWLIFHASAGGPRWCVCTVTRRPVIAWVCPLGPGGDRQIVVNDDSCPWITLGPGPSVPITHLLLLTQCPVLGRREQGVVMEAFIQARPKGCTSVM